MFLAWSSQIRKKLSGALIYARLTEDEHPIFIYDSTAFGSAKEGYLITNKAIHIKYISYKIILWSDVVNVEKIAFSPSKVTLANGENVAFGGVHDGEAIQYIWKNLLAMKTTSWH